MAITIGFPVYQNATSLDFIGPIQILTYLDDVQMNPICDLKVVAETMAPVVTTEGLHIVPDLTFAQCGQLDIVCVPGGGPGGNGVPGITDTLRNPTYLDFLATQGRNAQWVTSVCTGALLLGQAGLLDGYSAITHWAFLDCLRLFPRVSVPTNYDARYVRDRNRITGGGISSGIDFGLYLASLLSDDTVAKQSQLINQYAPAPPYDDGLPHAADPAVCAFATAFMQPAVEACAKAIKEGPAA